MDRNDQRYIRSIPALAPLLDGADHVSVRSAEGAVPLDAFLAGVFAYRPRLIRALYRIRAAVVRLIGVRQPPLPEMEEWIPSEVPMLSCGNIWFFSVSLARPECYWFGCCPEERHLTAYLGVAAQPLGKGRNRFHFATIVHYKHWTGRLYFLLIRPVNRFFVDRLLRAGLTGAPPPAAGAGPEPERP